jgi:hypothetical protein
MPRKKCPACGSTERVKILYGGPTFLDLINKVYMIYLWFVTNIIFYVLNTKTYN